MDTFQSRLFVKLATFIGIVIDDSAHGLNTTRPSALSWATQMAYILGDHSRLMDPWASKNANLIDDLEFANTPRWIDEGVLLVPFFFGFWFCSYRTVLTGNSSRNSSLLSFFLSFADSDSSTCSSLFCTFRFGSWKCEWLRMMTLPQFGRRPQANCEVSSGAMVRVISHRPPHGLALWQAAALM